MIILGYLAKLLSHAVFVPRRTLANFTSLNCDPKKGVADSSPVAYPPKPRVAAGSSRPGGNGELYERQRGVSGEALDRKPASRCLGLALPMPPTVILPLNIKEGVPHRL
jgi:hypothetical protein